MKWEIFYSAESKQDLRKILDYISEELHEPGIARNLVRHILGEIGKLDEMQTAMLYTMRNPGGARTAFFSREELPCPVCDR